jgi:hypothetical protein
MYSENENTLGINGVLKKQTTKNKYAGQQNVLT